MSFLRMQQSRCLLPPKSPSPGGAFGATGLSHKEERLRMQMGPLRY